MATTAGVTAKTPGSPAAIGWMILAVFLFSTMDATVKWLEGVGYSVAQVLFFRGFFALLLILAIVSRRGGWVLLRTRRPLGHVTRSLIGVVTMACFFYAYKYMALADAVAISFAAPLFSTILSVLVLGERVGRHRWTAVAVGFIGVMIILRPGAGVLTPAAMVALTGTVGYAVATIVIRQLSRTESTVTTVFYFMVTSVVVTAAFLPFDWHTPDLTGWLLLIGVGLVGGAAQMAITRALAIGPIAVVAPFDYTALLWSIMFGFELWGDFPDEYTLLGSLIVIACGIYILYRETRRPAASSATLPLPN